MFNLAEIQNDGRTFRHKTPLTGDEVCECMDVEKLLHKQAGWNVVELPAAAVRDMRLVCTKGDTVRQIFVKALVPPEEEL